MEQKKTVAIVVFDEAEVLDFAGPFEVFSVTGKWKGESPFDVFLVAQEDRPVIARNHFSVNPHYTFANAPAAEIILIPGGYGTRQEMNNPVLLDWVKERAAQAELVLSVCTGSLVLAKAGLLDGLAATTHWMAIDLLKEVAPQTRVLEDERVVDNGKIIVSAGVASGVDMSLYVVGKLLGEQTAKETAKYIEWPMRTNTA